MKKFLCVTALAALASSAQAQVWNEVGDAPAFPVPGQDTVGVGPLNLITGGLPAGSNDIDMYCIQVTDPVGFSATVTGGTIYDSSLFLFDLGGNGITHNDDNGGGPLGLWSAIGAGGPGPGVGPIPAGTYALAISTYDLDPVNGGGLDIWLDSPFGDETAPDGAGGVIAGWGGTNFDFGTYEITLTGATYCIPEPTTMALLVLGGLALVRRR